MTDTPTKTTWTEEVLDHALYLRRQWLGRWKPIGPMTTEEKAAWDQYCAFLTANDMKPEDVWAHEATSA